MGIYLPWTYGALGVYYAVPGGEVGGGIGVRRWG